MQDAAAPAPATLAQHQHGKARVRVGRTWRLAPGPDGSPPVHAFVEWAVDTCLESDMAHAFRTPSNAGMTATDTQRNTVCAGEEEGERGQGRSPRSGSEKKVWERAILRVPWRADCVASHPHARWA